MNSAGEGFDPYKSSFGAAYGSAGVVLLVVGGLLLANVNEDDIFGIGAVVFLGAGLYFLVAGAVARGIQLARR